MSLQGPPPGRHELPQELIDRYKRYRAAVAVGEIASEEGLHQLTVSRVTKRAKMSRGTFYELFENREAAIRYALDLANGWLKEAIDKAADSDGPWPRRIEAVLESLLGTVEAHVHLSELCLVHGCGAEGAEAPFDPELVQTLAGVLRPGRRDGPKPGPGPRTEELFAYGILAVAADRLREGEAKSLRGLSRELSALAVRSLHGSQSVPDRTRA
jgi:AcrR family transcriptional regulator